MSSHGTAAKSMNSTKKPNVKRVTGPAFIYREQQQRYIPIKFSVRGRDLGSTVLEAQRKIAQEVPLRAGYRLEWVGEFGNLQDAIKRLRVIVPLTILLIGILLYVNFASLTDTLLGIAVILLQPTNRRRRRT
jgi:cobalt-zinc-cadmium resistance protein CzcA